jgi:16S rRNA (guanine966-N2)-methyltransferase
VAVAKQSEKNKKVSRGRLRIVAGIWRSRVLEIADLPGLRPTSERIRETLFNWLAPRIAGARCLDLFAGTGALGLEALSRGAASAVFVEKSKAATDTLRKNIATLGADGAQVKMTAAIEFLNNAGDGTFDVVFLDPPFAHDNVGELCRLIDEQGLLAGGAHVYLEQDRGRPEPLLPDGWSVAKKKTTGNVRYMLIAS